ESFINAQELSSRSLQTTNITRVVGIHDAVPDGVLVCYQLRCAQLWPEKYQGRSHGCGGVHGGCRGDPGLLYGRAERARCSTIFIDICACRVWRAYERIPWRRHLVPDNR